MPYGQYSKNSDGYSDVPSSANGAYDYNGRDYGKDAQKYAALSATLTKQAADDGLVRTKDMAGFAEGVTDRATKRDFGNAVTAKREDAAITKQIENNRAANTALESNKDRELAVTSMNAKASEAAKDRASTSFDNSSTNASNLAGIVSTVEGQRDAAKIQGRTTLSGQQAAIEQARVAAQAQVSSALLGGRANYGGYW